MPWVPPSLPPHGGAGGQGARYDPATLIRPVLAPPAGDGPASQKHAFWARVCSLNAVLLVCVNLFFYAYFA